MIQIKGSKQIQAESSRWVTLPLEEKKKQFKELIRSSYWSFLPREIQDRILVLVHEGKGNGKNPLSSM